MEEDNVQKYKELFEYTKEVYLEEIKRFDLITHKATQYLSVISVILGLALVFGKWLVSELIPSTNILSHIILISSAIFYTSLIVAWILNFQILRGGPLRKLPLNDTVIEFFRTNKRINIYYAYTRRINEGHSKNLEETNKRARLMTLGHRWILLSISFLIFLTLLGVMYQIKILNREDIKGGKEVTDEKINNNPVAPEVNPSPGEVKPTEIPAGKVSLEPNPNIVAPMMDIITHGEQHVGMEKAVIPRENAGIVYKADTED